MRKILLVIVAILLMVSIGLACGQEPEPEPEPEPETELLCTIIRDDYGVPHVFADTKEGLAFGAGYAMAHDRLWQADVMRRAATGRLAEFGLAAIEEDEATRTVWYSQEELLQMYDDWDPGEGYQHLKPMIEAYVEGINTYIDDAKKDEALKPIEYFASGLMDYIEPFTVADVVGLTVLMGWRFGGTGGNEGDFYEALLTLQAMHGATNGTDIWDDLFPLNNAGAPVTIPATGCEPLTAFSTDVTSPDVPDNLSQILQKYEDFWAIQDELFKSLGIPTKFGSNAVPVSSDLSASGNALELGGPQMGYSIPQIVYDLGLHGAGINAQGMAMPAAGPFILIGVSEYGAWTSTTGASDVTDVRILTLNPGDSTQYWHDDGWVDMEARTETIYGFKKETSQNVTCYRSVYGPIVAVDLDADTAITLHTPFFKNEIAGEQSWQLFQEATDIDEFEAAVELTVPNRNNKPIADWEYAESDIHWGEGFRVQILMDAMATFAAAGNLTTDDLNTLNQIGGYHSTGGMNFAGNVTAAALASGNATLLTAGSYLAAWASATPLPVSYVDLVSPKWPDDEDPTYDHPGLTIFNAWYDRIFSEVFTGILPPDLIAQVKNYPSLLIRVFRQDAGLAYLGYPSGATLNTMIVEALEEAVDYLTADYSSSDMSTWLTPVRMQDYDEQGALPGEDLHPYMNRGTYTQIAEMIAGDLPNAVNVIPPGQSGLMGLTTPIAPSPHAYDQVELYASWTYKPMLFTLAAVEAVKTWEKDFYVE